MVDPESLKKFINLEKEKMEKVKYEPPMYIPEEIVTEYVLAQEVINPLKEKFPDLGETLILNVQGFREPTEAVIEGYYPLLVTFLSNKDGGGICKAAVDFIYQGEQFQNIRYNQFECHEWRTDTDILLQPDDRNLTAIESQESFPDEIFENQNSITPESPSSISDSDEMEKMTITEKSLRDAQRSISYFLSK